MEDKKLFVIAAENIIQVVMKDKRIQFTRENPEFDEIKELVRSGNQKALLNKIMQGTKILSEYSKDSFKQNGEKIIDVETNTEVSLVLGKRILEWSKKGLPFEPLLRFHRKIILNPEKESANDLYAFLEANKIPITNEGNFIAYKKVKYNNKKQLVDCYTGRFDNSIGNIVIENRNLVDKNRNNTCSKGLHVAGYSYMSEYHGDVILEVEVEPQDVVAVPTDYNKAKMRVWKYKVLGICKNGERTSSFVKVNKTEISENKINATIEDIDLNIMTAAKIKEYIFENYKINMTDNNKNKQGIIKKAYKIISENKK